MTTLVERLREEQQAVTAALGVRSFVIDEAAAYIEKLERTAHCGTVDSFLQLSDEDKRKWFVLALRESEARKKAENGLETAEARIVELKYALATMVELHPTFTKKTKEALSRTDNLEALAEHDREVRREALLEAAEWFDNELWAKASDELRRMAEEST